MPSPSLLDALSRLGLSEREARAYLFLLRHGEATAREVSEGTDIPISKVYSVLKSLEEKGWVTADRSTRPARYAPINPEIAVERSIERELERQRRELEEQARRALRELARSCRAHRRTVAQVYEGEAAEDALRSVLRHAEEVCGIVHVGEEFPDWLARELSRVSGPLIVRCEKPPFDHPRMIVKSSRAGTDVTILTLSIDRNEVVLARVGRLGHLLVVREEIIAEGLRDAILKVAGDS
ncbi:MAG: helix-turn-helix domain-containing protein [Euryarchaeota archaeon]